MFFCFLFVFFFVANIFAKKQKQNAFISRLNNQRVKKNKIDPKITVLFRYKNLFLIIPLLLLFLIEHRIPFRLIFVALVVVCLFV